MQLDPRRLHRDQLLEETHAMSDTYGPEPELITLVAFLARDCVHAFGPPRVVRIRDSRGVVRAPVRFCACGQATSNGIPNLADQVRIYGR